MNAVRYPLFGPPQPRLRENHTRIITQEQLLQFDGTNDRYGTPREVYTAILGIYVVCKMVELS